MSMGAGSERPSGFALIPFAVFAIFYVGLSLYAGRQGLEMPWYKVPMPIAFLVASAVALVFGRRPLDVKIDTYAKGMGETNIMIMCLIFILAGSFATVAKGSGAVDAAVALAQNVIPPRLMVAGVFLVSCLISTAIGTSCGTISAVAPIALGFAEPLDLPPALLLGAVVAGAMFGDNLSMISDTTIAATRTQGVQMRDKFRANILLAVPAAFGAFLLYALAGSAADVAAAPSVGWREGLLVLPYLLILGLALAGFNVMALLFSGTLLAAVIGGCLGRFDFFGALDLLGKGALGMSETLIVALLAGGLFKTVQANGGIAWLTDRIARWVKGPRTCEAGVAFLTAAVNCFTANNTVAIVIAGPIAKECSDTFKANPVRIASVLDTASCIVQGLIPYGAQILIAIGVAKGVGQSIGSVELLGSLFYQPLLALAVLASFFIRRRVCVLALGVLGCALQASAAEPAAELQRYAELTVRRIAEIRSSPNRAVPDGASCRYLSERTGDDARDGLTPATAWKTTARLDREELAPGTFVLFERGGLYRGGFKAATGVTYTAYGTGEKPRIYSSPENGADPAKWRETEVKGVWAYPIGKLDVGTMVFNDGEAHAIKILPVYNEDGTYTQQYGKRPFNRGYADLAEDLHFWHDYSEKTDFKPFAKGTGLVYLKSEENPGRRFRSIEFCVRKHGIAGGGKTDVTIDNLCIKYVGSHGIGFGTTKNLRVTNCEFGWIGGSIQAERIFGRRWAVRYGNAVEIYGGCADYAVENCYIYEVYDAGLTHQYNLARADEVRNMTNVRYANNVVARCNYSIEYFLSKVKPENPSLMDGFVICSNLMWNAGTGFCTQRPDLNQAAHVKSWCNWANRAQGYVIHDNVFGMSSVMLIEAQNNLRNADGSDSLPKLERNVFFGRKGDAFGLVCEGKPSRRPFDPTDTPAFLDTLGAGNLCYEIP